MITITIPDLEVGGERFIVTAPAGFKPQTWIARAPDGRRFALTLDVAGARWAEVKPTTPGRPRELDLIPAPPEAPALAPRIPPPPYQPTVPGYVPPERLSDD